MSKYEMQEKFVEYLLSENNIVAPSDKDIMSYRNSIVNYLVPNPDESTNFSIGVRDWGRLFFMYFFFPDLAKKELIQLYEDVRTGKTKLPRRAIPSEKFFREIWDRYNHVSNQ